MPILALTALVLALLVVGGILLVGGIGVPTATPTPSASTPVASATDPLATPEGAVRGFFEAPSLRHVALTIARYVAVRHRDKPRPPT